MTAPQIIPAPPEAILIRILIRMVFILRTLLASAASLLQATRDAIRYALDVQLWSADRVGDRIDALARVHPGGVVAVDGDGTLWSGDVGDDLFHAFLQHGRVETPALEALRREARDHGHSDAGSGPDIARRIYDAYLEGRFPEERMCELMTWCFAGWKRSEVRDFARIVVVERGVASRLHEEMLRVLERIRASAIDAVIVSASPIDVVVEAGARVGFAGGSVIAARPHCENDVVLADVERPIPYAAGKVKCLRRQVGTARVLYAAFGDNAFDVALLASASLAVAVRPKPRLRERAHEIDGIVELQMMGKG